MFVAASMAGATLCMVLVHSTMKSAPGAPSAVRGRGEHGAGSAQSPSCCRRSISAKLTLYSTILAECRPPRRAFHRFVDLAAGHVDSQLMPPRRPMVFMGCDSWRMGSAEDATGASAT